MADEHTEKFEKGARLARIVANVSDTSLATASNRSIGKISQAEKPYHMRSNNVLDAWIEEDFMKQDLLEDTSSEQKKCRLCFDTQDPRRKYLAIVKLILLVSIPVTVLILQNAISLFDITEIIKNTEAQRDRILFTIELNRILHNIQLERGTTVLFVSSEVRYE